MKWFILLVGIVVLCLVVALLLGLAGGGLGRASSSLSHEPLADTDFDDLVFDVGVRGYRMSQVDGVVDRLRRELREKDEEIAVLRGEPLARDTDAAAAEPVTEATPEHEPDPASAAAPEHEPAAAPDPVGTPETPVVDDGGARATSAPTGGHERTP